MSILWLAFQSYPHRILRLFSHLFFQSKLKSDSVAMYLLKWIPAFGFYILDLIFFPEIYTFITMLKKSQRYFERHEKVLAGRILPEKYVNALMVDNNAKLTTNRGKIIYVSFYTVNSYGIIPVPVFMHEIVHVWQFFTYGSVYILHALWAQKSKEKYDYGQSMQGLGIDFDRFNFEQQGSLIEDYYWEKLGERGLYVDRGNGDYKDAMLAVAESQFPDIKKSGNA